MKIMNMRPGSWGKLIAFFDNSNRNGFLNSFFDSCSIFKILSDKNNSLSKSAKLIFFSILSLNNIL